MIKKCPICGSEVDIETIEECFESEDGYTIKCKNKDCYFHYGVNYAESNEYNEKHIKDKCPFCGKPIIYKDYIGSQLVGCETDNCYFMMGGQWCEDSKEVLLSKWNYRK